MVFAFVFPNRPEIESGNGDLIADSELTPEQLNGYIGKPAFEDICRQYLNRLNRKKELPFTATSFGSWWGNDPKAKAQTDLDVIAANKNQKQILIGECKWRPADTLGSSDIASWMSKTHLLPEYTDRYYYCFSKAGFTDSVKSFAEKQERLKLFDLDDLFTL